MSNSYDRFNSWKGLAYADKLRQIAKGEMPTPANWHVYPSNSCPYSCDFCIMKDEHENNPRAQLSKGTLEKLAADAKRLNVSLVHISGGGEPLTNPYVNDFIKNLKPTKVAMSTNGYLLPRLTEPIDHLRVSFNAGTRETYKQIHGVDGFYRVIGNVKNAVQSGIAQDIGMGFVLTPQNASEVNDFVKVAEDCGVRFVHIRPAYWPEKDKEIKALDVKPRSSEKVDVFYTAEKFGGLWDAEKFPCRATPLHAVTSATGEFLLCQDRLDIRFGDYNTQSFEDIWFSQEHLDAIQKGQDCKIRCVECGLNKMIEKAFVKNDLRLELI